MRIIIGTESFYPNISGVAIAVWNLASYLAAEGHQVLVIAPSTGCFDELEQYPEGFSVQRLRSVPNPFRRKFRVTLYPLAKIKAVVRSWHPDLIHLEDPISVGACLARAARAYQIPLVISHHFSLEYILSYCRLPQLLNRYLQWFILSSVVRFYNRSQHVICPSDIVQHFLAGSGVRVPITTVSNGVDLDRFFSYESPASIRAELGLPDLPVVLYVGRMDQDKNLEVLWAAIPPVLERCRALFVFCGSGNLLPQLRKKAVHEGLAANVALLGQIDHQTQDLPRMYQIATCFVMPSQIETQSIVCLEAMASGLPVIAARGGALPELVSEGETGLLFSPQDPLELADKICHLLEDPQLVETLGHNALQKVVGHELKHSLHRVEETYREVIAHYHA